MTTQFLVMVEFHPSKCRSDSKSPILAEWFSAGVKRGIMAVTTSLM
ncbi:MAG: hypothetical protein JO235_06925 [Chroococcidiopsidaceae cyanobacterium CP_BM_RX_35]|nr:hypothetical protein [Chroococcidiopsidaceae cyanobacterium CP_BM_RX_35]